MKSLTELQDTTLEWRQAATQPETFELHTEAGTFATLAFLDERCALARVETAEGTWTLKHLGLLNPVVTLREEGGKANLATFHPHALRHGSLQFQDGAAFEWAWYPGTGPGGTFLDAEGLPLVRLRAHPGRDLTSKPGFERCEVDLNQAAPSRSRHALLAAFGWYLILFDHLKEQDAAAAETALRL